MSTKGTDWKSLAKSIKRQKGGTTCSICSKEEVAEAVRTMCEARADGETTISYVQMAELIETHLGIPMKGGTLRVHVAEHLPDLYQRIRQRDGTA